MPVEVQVEKWGGQVKTVKLGGNGRKSIAIGGENTLPFLKSEGAIPNPPAIAVEIWDKEPGDWASNLTRAWGALLQDPAKWARKAAEIGADIIVLRLKSAHPEEGNTGAEAAKAVVTKVLAAVDLPLIVLGPDVAEKDNQVLMAASEAAKGQRIALGNCVDKNYRTIVASCLADGHVAVAKTPIDMNLAKQLNILISDVGLSPDSILMDPTTGALGYGLEYTYSVMERLRLAALQGDSMTSMPMMCTVGEESWRQKESKFDKGVPESWGDQNQRSLVWEGATAVSLLHSGANVVVLRHPESVRTVKAIINKLMAA